MKKSIICLVGIAILVSCSPTESHWKEKTKDPAPLHRTVKEVTDIIVYDIFSPPVASRIYAYITVAAYEAGRHDDPNLLTLAGQLHKLEPVPQPDPKLEYCFPLAAVSATVKTSRAFLFSEDIMDPFYDKLIAEYKTKTIPADVYERSIAYGDLVAQHIIAWSAKDNYKQSRSFPKYTIQTKESTWQPTAPAYMDAVEPHWNKIRTFVIDSASQFRPEPPPKFSTDKTSIFYGYAREVYDVGKNLTPEQISIASFWDCNPFVINVKGHVSFATKKISPGGHWMNITRVACETAKLDPARSSEAYVRCALSLADGFIACWDEKYRSLLVRPETYINKYIDPNWAPLLQTPPFPEYVSGHSVISGAASSALTHNFGDKFAFTDSTEVEFGLTMRSFKSFYQAADEAAVSRLYGGIHYRPANEIGAAMGHKVGDFIANHIRTRKQSTAELSHK